MSQPLPQPPTDPLALAGPVAAVLAEAALSAVIGVLQRRPDLAVALRQLITTTAPTAPLAQAFSSVAQYAAYRSVSERTIRYDIEKMVEGRHFHRAGRKGGRVVIHVREADAWYAHRAGKRDVGASVEELAIDEVTRRRARVALKKRREKE